MTNTALTLSTPLDTTGEWQVWASDSGNAEDATVIGGSGFSDGWVPATVAEMVDGATTLIESGEGSDVVVGEPFLTTSGSIAVWTSYRSTDAEPASTLVVFEDES